MLACRADEGLDVELLKPLIQESPLGGDRAPCFESQTTSGVAGMNCCQDCPIVGVAWGQQQSITKPLFSGGV